VTNNGQSQQTGHLIDPATATVLDEKPVAKSWYGLAFSPGGDQKGISAAGPVQYIGGLFKGTLSVIPTPGIPTPGPAQLKAYTAQVYANTPFTPTLAQEAPGQAGNPVPRRRGEASPIKYDFYVIKENRTYDQVLGDVKEGNGDSTLCLFPERVTPNHHALAREFGLLDNFYVNAEVSADGHNWTMAAYANDYVEKTWPISNGGRGGTYNCEGTRPIAYPATASSGTTASAPAAATAPTASLPRTAKRPSSPCKGTFAPSRRAWT